MPDCRSYQNPFYGWTVPKAISLCIQTLKECNSLLPFEAIQKLISMSEAQILHEKTSTSSLEILMRFSKDYSVSFERLIIIFNGFVHVIQLALKPPAAFFKSDIFKDRLRELKFSEQIIEEFHNILFGSKRDQLYNVIQDHHPRLPFLQSFDWNLDVTLTTASLSRCIEPLLFFQFRTNDNRTVTFEVPIKRFNDLRYNTALLLKEMEEIDGKQALKLLET